MRDEKNKNEHTDRRRESAMGDDAPPPPPPPAVDAVTATQSALETAVRLMFETAGTTQRDAPPRQRGGRIGAGGQRTHDRRRRGRRRARGRRRRGGRHRQAGGCVRRAAQ